LPRIELRDRAGLHYDRPIEPSLAVLRSVREASLQLLESLTDDEWQGAGAHSESAPTRSTTGRATNAGHSHDHADQIRRARRGEARTIRSLVRLLDPALNGEKVSQQSWAHEHSFWVLPLTL
jgi:hypothetical protein